MGKFSYINNEQNDFLPVEGNTVEEVEKELGFEFPEELKQFYKEVGYGFIKGKYESSTNLLMAPETIKEIRLREDFYEYDLDLEMYEDESKLIFFEESQGMYLELDLEKDKGAVYKFDKKIANNLEEFFKKFVEDEEYYLK